MCVCFSFSKKNATFGRLVLLKGYGSSAKEILDCPDDSDNNIDVVGMSRGLHFSISSTRPAELPLDHK